MKGFFATLICLSCACFANADAPDGFYSPLVGKKGDQLMDALRRLAADHRVVSYNAKTWKAFELTDVRSIKSRQVWWDMYSNNLVYLPAHASLNIEHAVPNSWWGGRDGSVEAYSDLFHLNPADQNANNKKANYPPGEVADSKLLDNGLLKIGTPAPDCGGGAQYVFEPADEYKGDFARAYFYLFSAYPDISWLDNHAFLYTSDGALRPWAATLLLKWHRNDPVDSKEIARNEAIFGMQGNRNPFIDCPGLAEYVWGNNVSQPFPQELASSVAPMDRPAPPAFRNVRLAGVNTYAGRWWDGVSIPIADYEGELYLSVDGAPFEPASELVLDPADTSDETHSFAAYSLIETDSHSLRSPVATLSMTARDPMMTDYSAARWQHVDSPAFNDFNSGYFIILAAHNYHALSVNGGSSSSSYMETAGFVEMADGFVMELPVEAALVNFEKDSSGKSRLVLRDIYGAYRGSWLASAKNKMKLDPVLYTPGSPKINADGTFSFAFDQYGSLQYNASQPRFLNYESSQQPVYLYKFKDLAGGWSGIEDISTDTSPGIGVDSGSIITGPDTRIFDLSGRPVNGHNLSPGIYIVVAPSGTRKISL